MITHIDFHLDDDTTIEVHRENGSHLDDNGKHLPVLKMHSDHGSVTIYLDEEKAYELASTLVESYEAVAPAEPGAPTEDLPDIPF